MQANAATLLKTLRREALDAPESGIVEVVNHGRLKEGLIPLWVGEGDLPTPRFIIEAANRSLADGETFYTYQRGIPELRAAIAGYVSRLYARPLPPERFFVVGSGMQALQIVLRMLAGTGDEVVVPTPAWPNFTAAAGVGGARPVEVPMRFGNAGWTLDMEQLEAAITPRTRALCINSPANPTGWTATREELAAILALARRHGIWIVADEIYGRFVYEGERAPSFHDVMQPEDRVVFVQTFSKNWSMTGWRAGWIEAPEAFGDIIENLVQYATSGVPVFVQRACLAAIEQGEEHVRWQVAQAKLARDIVCDAIGATGRARFARPDGAFYLFFGVDGITDARAAAIRMVDEAGVGLAPGTAFGAAGEGFFRLCFARRHDHLTEAARRIAAWIAR